MLDSLCSLFLTFLAYSCLGWAFESLCCSVIARRPINRGFLTGPVCPIYGVGALLVIYLLSPFAGSLPLLFVAAVLVTSVLEYVTGWALETLFHAKWWDYSDHRFNIHGRVCLQNALVFGVLGVVVVRIIHPVVEGWILSLGGTALYLVSGGLFLVFAADLATTLITLIRLQGKLAQLQQLAAQLRQRSEAYQQALELNLNLRRSELEEMLESRLQELHRRREALGLPSREELSEKLGSCAAAEPPWACRTGKPWNERWKPGCRSCAAAGRSESFLPPGMPRTTSPRRWTTGPPLCGSPTAGCWRLSPP